MHIDVINGLLGAGKTTFLLNLLEQKASTEKVAVLVNEFGEIGIDGDLLSGQGADVVELPNGCICCTLTADLRTQIKFIAETYHPNRLLIEPTGVATIKNLMNILKSLSLEKYIDDIRVIVVIDASTFQEILGQNRGFVETQLAMAQVIVVNKCDKVDSREINNLKSIIQCVNKTGHVFFTSFGRVSDIDINPEVAEAADKEGCPHCASGHPHHHGDGHADENNCEHDHDHELPLKQYEQFSGTSGGIFNQAELRNFFGQIRDGLYGPVDRAKGIFQVAENRWLRMDLASHEISEVILERTFKSGKIMVIGTQLQKENLREDFNNCLVKTNNKRKKTQSE